jgi:hypothetical protein
MFESAVPPRNRHRGALVVALSGAMTFLSYYGIVWWAGLPAFWTMYVLASADRSVTVRTLIFVAAVLVNVMTWVAVFHLLLWLGDRAKLRLFRRH